MGSSVKIGWLELHFSGTAAIAVVMSEKRIGGRASMLYFGGSNLQQNNIIWAQKGNAGTQVFMLMSLVFSWPVVDL